MKRALWLKSIVLLCIVVLIIVGVFCYLHLAHQRPVTIKNGSIIPSGQQTNTVTPQLRYVTIEPTCGELFNPRIVPASATGATAFFYPCDVPPVVDTSTFVVVGSSPFPSWAKDKNGVYFYQDRVGDGPGQIIEIQGADTSTFEEVPSSSGFYYKDTNYVYTFSAQNEAYSVTTTPDVDAATFTGIGHDYFTDKNGVYLLDDYWNWQKINSADPSTFQYVGVYVSPYDVMGDETEIAKDKNCIYDAYNKILDANGVCINPVGCTPDSLAANPSSCGLP